MTPLEMAQLLMEKAAQDEAAAARYAHDAAIADEIIGFHCQQACEKMLKAVLMAAGVPFPRTHDLTALLDLLATHGRAVPTALDSVRLFSPFAVEYRYAAPPAESRPLDRVAAADLVAQLRARAEAELASLASPTS